MKRGRRAPGLSATARASLPARFSTSLSGLLRGVAMTSRPCLIVQAYVAGAHPAHMRGAVHEQHEGVGRDGVLDSVMLGGPGDVEAQALGGHHHLERLRGDGLHRHVRPSPHHVDGDREPHTPPRRSRGFRATLRPSPSTLRSRTRTKIAAPGNPGTHHASVTYSSPLASIWPRLTTFGSPTPRKLSDASARMAEEPSSASMAPTR